ncbi:MAG TPA: hypothetical protein VK698_38570 [Kofleriaceae bacterium]|nr:hypothetical protein [Kofleriaceae bacterium]
MKSDIERVRQRIGEELAVCGDLSPEQGLGAGSLESRLVRPPRLEPFTSEFESSPDRSTLWLVLDECPGQDTGYLVIYDATRDEFGLAGKGTGGDAGVVLGWYGSLRDTLQAM